MVAYTKPGPTLNHSAWVVLQEDRAWETVFSQRRTPEVNGKMAGFGAFITMGYSVYSAFKADGDVFIPRPLYAYAGVVLLGALHIFAFPSNPLPEKTTEVKNNHGNFSDLAALSLLGVALSWYFYPEHLFQDSWQPSGTLYPFCWLWVPLSSNQPKKGCPYYNMGP